MARLVGLKAGDIVRTASHRQYFFVHKVDGDRITTSGIDTIDGDVFPKGRHWSFN